jgi:hypothetical protein
LPPNTVVEVHNETDDHENIFVIDEEDMICEITNKEVPPATKFTYLLATSDSNS